MTGAAASEFLSVRGLTKVYPSPRGPLTVLEPTTFAVGATELVSIVGPSGCGKSTCLHMIGGLIRPSGGEVILDGAPVTEAGAERGMVFQSYTLFPWMTVRQNVAFGPRLRGVKRQERERLADHFLDAVGLDGFGEHLPRQLSGGMRQRVAIARALANGPRILLMDEPFGALDAQTRSVMQDLLLAIRARERVTTLFVTHDIDEAVYLSDRILVMTARPGRLTAEIPVSFGPDRDDSLRLSPEFFELRKSVHAVLHTEGKAVVEAEIAAGKGASRPHSLSARATRE